MAGFMAPTGRIIKEYLEERGISQKDLAQRIDVSEKHISNMLNGKTRLTEDMALRLEHVMPDVSAGYWLNYEAKYREYLAREEERCRIEKLDLEDIARRFHFAEVFKDTDMTLAEQADEMLDLLGVASFDCWRASVPGAEDVDLKASGDPEAAVVWLSLCRDEAVDQRDEMEASFGRRKLSSALDAMKEIPADLGIDGVTQRCRELLHAAGVILVAEKPIGECRIQAALVPDAQHPAIYISKGLGSGAAAREATVHEAELLSKRSMPRRMHIVLEEPLRAGERYATNDGEQSPEACGKERLQADMLLEP
ncbi:MAG: HigA family addiction module antitoxin [Atopobiaceae bacterium]